MNPYVWRPSPEYVDRANVMRLARRHGIADIHELRRRSVADIAWYWNSVVNDLGLVFSRPYERVVDLAGGKPWPSWFAGSRCNVADSCVVRWTANGHGDRPAVVHEDESGQVRRLSYAELDRQVRAVAAGLRRLGIGKGDSVGLFLPMVPEAVVSLLAIAWNGSIAVPLFSGFASGAITARLEDSAAKAVIVAAGTVRRGRHLSLQAVLDESLADCSTVRSVIVVGSGEGHAHQRVQELSWSELVSTSVDDDGPQAMGPDDPLLLAYTSGTTGRPKGAVHTHPGFLVKTASELAYSFDVSRGDVFSWITDMGWIMGPLSVVGCLANGASLLLYEGAPDVPDLGRIWSLAERHGVTALGISPTLIRTIRSGAPDAARESDLSSVRIIGSTGETWDEASYDWLGREVLGGAVPIINFSGGTEVGGSLLAPYPVEDIAACSVGGPSLGMDVDVFDSDGQPVRDVLGELVCKQPWPSMTRGIWNDNERYIETYWQDFPGVWRHGDFAVAQSDGCWYLQGRSDDVMNVAGKRLAPAELENLASGHPAVVELAAVGVPDEMKGESPWLFWVARATGVDDDEVGRALRRLVADGIGKPFAPTQIIRVDQLPKTRSGKIVRRALRATAIGNDPGDMSSIENPDCLLRIRAAISDTV